MWHELPGGEVFQLREEDADQEIYGPPERMPAVQAALLNESATLFRRNYYNNGSQAGYILYMTDPHPQGMDVDALRRSRGPGNFKNLFVHSPNGNMGGLHGIPVSEVSAMDQFAGIREVTRDDMLAALRVPPQLLSIVPHKSGVFWSNQYSAVVSAAMKHAPLQVRMTAINEWLGQEATRLDEFNLGAAPPQGLKC